VRELNHGKEVTDVAGQLALTWQTHYFVFG